MNQTLFKMKNKFYKINDTVIKSIMQIVKMLPEYILIISKKCNLEDN